MSKINGFLLLDKPQGKSSNQALYPVKKLLPKGTKIGHTGTLDPGATGLLVIALGRATRFISYLKSNQKAYEAVLRLGLKTDSADIWGSVIEEREARKLIREELEQALGGFLGEIEQIPPMFSALKREGRPLYELARKGIEVERRPRRQYIYSIELLAYEHPEATIRVVCDAGTYIRTLIEDVAESLGELATMTALRRLYSDGFSLDGAICANEDLSPGLIEGSLVSLDEAFKQLPSLELSRELIRDLRNGKKRDLSSYLRPYHKAELLRLNHRGGLCALAEVDKGTRGLAKILWTEEGLNE